MRKPQKKLMNNYEMNIFLSKDENLTKSNRLVLAYNYQKQKKCIKCSFYVIYSDKEKYNEKEHHKDKTIECLSW